MNNNLQTKDVRNWAWYLKDGVEIKNIGQRGKKSGLAQVSPVITLPFCLKKVSRPQRRGGTCQSPAHSAS